MGNLGNIGVRFSQGRKMSALQKDNISGFIALIVDHALLELSNE